MILSHILQTRASTVCVNSLMTSLVHWAPCRLVACLCWTEGKHPCLEVNVSLEFSNAFETEADTVSWEPRDRSTPAWPQIRSPIEPQQGRFVCLSVSLTVWLSVCRQCIGHATRPPASMQTGCCGILRDTLKPGQQLQALAEAWKGSPGWCEGEMNRCSTFTFGHKVQADYFYHNVRELSF